MFMRSIHALILIAGSLLLLPGGWCCTWFTCCGTSSSCNLRCEKSASCCEPLADEATSTTCPCCPSQEEPGQPAPPKSPEPCQCCAPRPVTTPSNAQPFKMVIDGPLVEILTFDSLCITPVLAHWQENSWNGRPPPLYLILQFFRC